MFLLFSCKEIMRQENNIAVTTAHNIENNITLVFFLAKFTPKKQMLDTKNSIVVIIICPVSILVSYQIF